MGLLGFLLALVLIGPVLLVLAVVLWAIHPLVCIVVFGGTLLLFVRAIP